MIATGVARPRAHGQEMTRTEIAKFSARLTSFEMKYQTIAQTTEIEITAGTKTRLTLSARREIGALLPAASSESAIIWESVVA